MNLGTYIMASEPISAAYFIITSHYLLCIYEYSYRCKETNQLCKNSSAVTNAHANVVFYASRVVSRRVGN
jgi:hypothetical protein